MNDMFDHDDFAGAFGKVPAKKDFLSGLNEKQRFAAETTEGPLVIMAGAGTGKTTVLTNRIAHIITMRLSAPQEILAVTFTRKAAGEMKQRLSKMLGTERGRKVRVGNFHSICSDILRRHADLIDLPKNFNILDEDGQRDVIATMGIERGYIQNKKDRNTINTYLAQISSWKEEGYDPDFINDQEDLSAVSDGPMSSDEDFLIKCAKIFTRYQEELRLRRWCDFADLILHVVRIFRKYPDIRAKEAQQYRYIVVDEFQDTSPVQYEWVKLMAMDHQNICVVGDTDQSIYEWRSARPYIMMNFHNEWDGCQRVTIDVNYRSSQEILDVSNTVVQPLREKDKMTKRLTSPRRGVAPQDYFETYGNGMDEAYAIARQIEQKIVDGKHPSEIAILCRSGMIIKGFERALRDQQIRYVVAGAMKFTDREEVKDAISYLTLASNPMDYITLERIAKKPSRGVGPQKISEIRKLMMSKRTTVKAAVDEIASALNQRTAAAQALVAFSNELTKIEEILNNSITAGQALEDILELTGYYDWRRDNDKDPQKDLRLENLEQLISEASAYDTTRDFLESMALQAGGDVKMFEDSIVLSTVHASKGLEFDVVFCPAMEEGVFPNSRSEQTAYGPDEERRLAHVAFTRARNELHISWARSRMGRNQDGIPSPYLFEIDMPVTDEEMNPVIQAVKRSQGPRRFRPRSF